MEVKILYNFSRMLVLSSILSFVLVPPCAAIFGGTAAAVGEFPFAVQLQMVKQDHNGPVYNCGGSIISPNIILTAAHCVHQVSKKRNPGLEYGIKITAGQIESNNHGGRDGSNSTHTHTQTRVVSEIIIHPSYVYDGSNSSSPENDVALLVLNYPLVLNEVVVSSIKVPSAGQVFEGVDAEFCGWGQTHVNVKPTSLLKTRARLLTEDEFVHEVLERANELLTLSETQLTFAQMMELLQQEKEQDVNETSAEADIYTKGHNNSSMCPGDSGSPLVCVVNGERYVCGVASWMLGSACGQLPELPSIFMKVAAFSDWIHNWVSEYNFTCSSSDREFSCGDGNCVPLTSRCDRTIDCPRGTDEINCDPCLESQFLCTSRWKCIDANYLCDGIHDCGDGSDELGCNGGGGGHDDDCDVDQFRCGTNTCIDHDRVCDGVKHCVDGRDETGCGECLRSELQCKNGRCVHADRICDGVDDCQDGSATDETGCKNISSTATATAAASKSMNCDRGLDYVVCLGRGCTFSKESRTCWADESLVTRKYSMPTPSKGSEGSNTSDHDHKSKQSIARTSSRGILFDFGLVILGVIGCIVVQVGSIVLWVKWQQMRRRGRRVTPGAETVTVTLSSPKGQPSNVNPSTDRDRVCETSHQSEIC